MIAHAYIVDDEDVIRRSLGRLLRSMGIPSTAHPSAESFLQSYTGTERGCLLVDVRMPGMSGLDLLDELRRRGCTLPAIVITGHTDEASSQRLTSLATIGVLEKPFSLAHLKEMLARCGA